jgi:hypothetical protein
MTQRNRRASATAVATILRARIDFDQRPIRAIAQHSIYGKQAAAESPRPTPGGARQGAS